MQSQLIEKTRLLLIPLLAFVALGLARPAAAEDSQWRTRFWNNTHFSGDPVVERHDSAVNFDWGQGSPASHVDDDNFSAKFNRRVNFAPGTYRFTATMDDGMRVFLDGNAIIDSWTDSQEHTMTRDLYVSGGEHDVKVEYYEVGGAAVAKVHWDLIQPESGSGSGGGAFYPNWKGEYYNNTSLSGSPVLVRDDRYLNFNWGTGSPAPGTVNSDNFSVRWTRTLNEGPGNYFITMTNDDGARLWVNNQLVIDNWAVQSTSTRTVGYYHPGGVASVRVEYFEQAGNALIDLHLGEEPNQPVIVPPVTLPEVPAPNCVEPTGFRATVNASSLNFRSGPSVDFPVLETLAECTAVQLTGYRNPVEASSPWVQVILPDGQTAWANANYMILGVPLSQMTVLSD
ncbi:MAG: PA14 domain-containing protein [Candidatus Promineifilaceae bacterium]|jgi:PA14 domain/Bacterial SH3 domain